MDNLRKYALKQKDLTLVRLLFVSDLIAYLHLDK